MTLRTLYHLPPIPSLDARRTALVLVDFQQEFFAGRLRLRDGTRALDRARHLLTWARDAHVTVVHVRNITRPGSPLFADGGPTSAFAPALAPRSDELVVTKPTGGAFTRTELDALLRARGVDTLVVAGLMTHLAVALTAQDATVLGYRVLVVADATATRDLPDTARARQERRTVGRRLDAGGRRPDRAQRRDRHRRRPDRSDEVILRRGLRVPLGS